MSLSTLSMIVDASLAVDLGILVWVWAGYPVLAWSAARWISTQRMHTPYVAPLPHVTLLIAAYNEEEIIDWKVESCRTLSYPRDRLDIVFVTDGSTDSTHERLLQYGYVQVMHKPERRGKAAAISRVVPLLRGELVICTDANTTLQSDALLRMVERFADPAVGGVAGAKRVRGGGEGVYWRYESALKRAESMIHSVMGAAGELIAFRRELWEPIPDDTILDDLFLSMRLVQRGWRVVYAEDAIAEEAPSSTPGHDFERRARIAAGGVQACWRLRGLLNIRRHGVISVMFASHRLMRWLLAPAALVLAPLLTIAGLLLGGGAIGAGLLWGLLVVQMIAAVVGGSYQIYGGRVAGIVHHFVLAHLAALAGVVRAARGAQSVLWEKAPRAKVESSQWERV